MLLVGSFNITQIGHFFSRFGEVMDVTLVLDMERVLKACAKASKLEHKRELQTHYMRMLHMDCRGEAYFLNGGTGLRPQGGGKGRASFFWVVCMGIRPHVSTKGCLRARSCQPVTHMVTLCNSSLVNPWLLAPFFCCRDSPKAHSGN